MTAAEAVAQADALEPNQYTQARKLAWLAELDGQISREILETHEEDGRADEGAGPYTGETELLVPAPWAGDLYRWALIAQFRLHNAESARYNQAIAAFGSAYRAFADHWNRTHAPRGARRWRL